MTMPLPVPSTPPAKISDALALLLSISTMAGLSVRSLPE